MNLQKRCLCLVLFLACAAAWAQSATGNIVGRITDPTGAAVPGVEVTATDPAKGVSTRATTDEQGTYRLLYLPPAAYDVTYTAGGFQTVQRKAIDIRANDTVTLDIPLTVGNVVDKIEVTGQTPLLEAATSTTGATIEGATVNRLPVQQRYMWMSMYFMPGVTSMNGFHIAGQRDRGIGYTMDGVSATEPVRGGVATNRIMSTTPNAVEEVKMTTTVMPAEYGHSVGGAMGLTFKSGTNALHGEAEDRYLNNDLKHRDYFVLSRPTTPFTYHELSGLLTGPVYLPKLYDGRNKTFFLFGYSRHHEKNDTQYNTQVPTPDMLGGNFAFPNAYQIYDPASTRQLADGTWTRDPFPGNIIPANRIDPAVQKFLSNNPWKLPNNLTGGAFYDRFGPLLNLSAVNVYRSYRTRYDVKIDQVFSEKNRMFGRFSHVLNRAFSREPSLNWLLLDNTAVLAPSDQINGVISDNHVFSPSLINEIRVGVNRRKESRTPPGLNENWAQTLGIPGVGGQTFPSLFNSTGGAFYNATMPGADYYQVTENFTVQDNLTKIWGQHQFKAGYELLRTRANTRGQSLPSGVYRFGGTDLPFTPGAPGIDFAGFLLGSVVRADYSTVLANWQPRWWSHAWFIQDDWKLTPKLTLNLGLRWSYESPFQTKYGQQSQFDPNTIDPVSGLRGAITHPSGPLSSRDLNNFQPRVGAAYRISNRTAFRGGFGLTSVDLFTAALDQNFEEYFTSVALQRPAGDPRPAFFLSQGPGAIPYNILPNGTSPFVGANYSGRQATWYDPNMRTPYVMNWNSTFQYQFANQWLMELTYQGSAGVRLLEGWNYNQVPLNVSNNAGVLNQIFQSYQNYRPWPQFGPVYLWSNSGHSTYHSGTLRVEKRLSRGFTLNSFYTWSKAINSADNDGIVTGVDVYNRSLEKARAGYDVAHRWVTYTTYELPFGRGKKWMNTNKFLDYFLGGWTLAGIQTFQTGVPVTFTIATAGSPNRYLPTGNQVRPDVRVANYNDIKLDNWNIGPNRFNANPMWDINAFAYPAAFTSGSAGRNIIDGPGLIWTQGSLAKVLTFAERYHLDVRFDINNVFKHPNFANPTSTVNLNSPGIFGKPTGTIGGFCCLGGQFVGTLGLRFWF